MLQAKLVVGASFESVFKPTGRTDKTKTLCIVTQQMQQKTIRADGWMIAGKELPDIHNRPDADTVSDVFRDLDMRNMELFEDSIIGVELMNCGRNENDCLEPEQFKEYYRLAASLLAKLGCSEKPKIYLITATSAVESVV